MLSKFISIFSFSRMSHEETMNLAENALGVATFEKKHLRIIRDVSMPWVMSYTGFKDNLEHIRDVFLGVNFEISRVSTDPIMEGQIQLVFNDGIPENCKEIIESNKQSILDYGDEVGANMKARGGGMRDVSFRELPGSSTNPLAMGVVDFLFDVRQANGANNINTIAEKLGPKIQMLFGGEVCARILSNECKSRQSEVVMRFPKFEESGIDEKLRDLKVYFETVDKMSMTYCDVLSLFLDGVHPVVEATGNDWRAADASLLVHALEDKLMTISESDEDFIVTCKMPIAVGIVGRCKKFSGAYSELMTLNLATAEQLAEITLLSGMMSVIAGFSDIEDSDGSSVRISEKKVVDSDPSSAVKPRLKIRDLKLISKRRSRLAEYINDPQRDFSYIEPSLTDPLRSHQVPFGISPRINLNGVAIDILPFLVEEASVVAANSYMASVVENVKGTVVDSSVEGRYKIDIEFEMLSERLTTKSTSGDIYKRGILLLHEFSKRDKKRTCTESKGLMNGVDPLLYALNIHKSKISAALYQQFFKDGRLTPFIEMKDLGDRIKVTLCAELPRAPFENCGGTEFSDRNLEILNQSLSKLDMPLPKALAVLCLVSGCMSTCAAQNAVGSKGINWGHKKLHDQA
jgi:hydroxymethylglutaryl-CoA reductase